MLVFACVNLFLKIFQTVAGTGPFIADSGIGMYVVRTLRDGTKSWVLLGIVSRTLQRNIDPNVFDLSNYIVFTDMAKLSPWLGYTSVRSSYHQKTCEFSVLFFLFHLFFWHF